MVLFAILLIVGLALWCLLDYRPVAPSQLKETRGVDEIYGESYSYSSLPRKRPNALIPPSLELQAKVLQVYYANANLPVPDTGHPLVEGCDTAVILQLDNGHWLSWEWEEAGKDGPEFVATYGEQDPRWEDRHLSFHEVITTKNWHRTTHQSLLSVEVLRMNTNLCGLVLHFSHQSIVICGLREPGEIRTYSSWKYEFEADWTAVIFDAHQLQQVVNQSNRLPEKMACYRHSLPRTGPVMPGPASEGL